MSQSALKDAPENFAYSFPDNPWKRKEGQLSSFWKFVAWTIAIIIVAVLNYYGIKWLGPEIIGSGVFSFSVIIAGTVAFYIVKIGSAQQNYFEAPDSERSDLIDLLWAKFWKSFKKGAVNTGIGAFVILGVSTPLLIAFAYWYALEQIFDLSYNQAGGVVILTIFVLLGIGAAIYKIAELVSAESISLPEGNEHRAEDLKKLKNFDSDA